MAHTIAQIGPSYTTPHKGQQTSPGGASTFASRSQITGVVLFSLFAMGLAFTPNAYAEAVSPPELAVLPDAGQSVSAPVKKGTRPHNSASIRVRGVCQDGSAVFTVKNGQRKWVKRGQLRIIDAQTGQVVRERWLRLHAGQRASFRIAPYLVPSHRYRVLVKLPNGSITHLKSFRGRCPQPSENLRSAQR